MTVTDCKPCVQSDLRLVRFEWTERARERRQVYDLLEPIRQQEVDEAQTTERVMSNQVMQQWLAQGASWEVFSRLGRNLTFAARVAAAFRKAVHGFDRDVDLFFGWSPGFSFDASGTPRSVPFDAFLTAAPPAASPSPLPGPGRRRRPAVLTA